MKGEPASPAVTATEEPSHHKDRTTLTAADKKQMMKIVGGTFVLMIVAIWALISLFWGSTYRLEYYFYRLTIHVYDFDSRDNPSPLLGPQVVQSLLGSQSAPTHFNVTVMNSTGVRLRDIARNVVNEGAWAAVVINSNATSAWNSAIAGTGGLVSGRYDPTGAISVVIASARFYQVILDYLYPFVSELLLTPTMKASQSAVATFLQSATPATLAALTTTQSSALASPFSFHQYDVRPIKSGQWSGGAPLEAGLIFFVIFAFHVAILMYIGRGKLLGKIKGRKLSISFPHFLIARIVPHMLAYFVLSLWYSLINLAFKVPMNGNGHSGLNSQAGFMVFWMLNFVTLAALGTAMESMITLVTIKFVPLFLITWIITNVASSFFPEDLMEEFYRYGYAMPFYHSTTADKFIFWGARNRLGLNFGVLIAWIALSTSTLILFEFFELKKRQKALAKEEQEAREKPRKEAAEVANEP